MKFGLRISNFFRCQGIFFINFDLKMVVQINLSIITRDQAADFRKKISHKTDFKATAMPTAWK